MCCGFRRSLLPRSEWMRTVGTECSIPLHHHHTCRMELSITVIGRLCVRSHIFCNIMKAESPRPRFHTRAKGGFKADVLLKRRMWTWQFHTRETSWVKCSHPREDPCLSFHSMANLPPSLLTHKNLWACLDLIWMCYVLQLPALQGQCFNYWRNLSSLI